MEQSALNLMCPSYLMNDLCEQQGRIMLQTQRRSPDWQVVQIEAGFSEGPWQYLAVRVDEI